jgi:hypothetical protein
MKGSFLAKDAADAERHLLACNALVDVLITDPRVETEYQNWLRLTGLSDLIAQWKSVTDAVKRREIEGELIVIYAATGSLMLSHVLPAFISKDLRLPYPWLALQLGAIFFIKVSESLGSPPLQLNIGIVPPRDQRRGRRAKGGGESIRRNVEWFYRVHVQQPTESIGSLARAYAKETKRDVTDTNDARSVVQNGIKRAKALLDQAEYVFLPPPK